MTLTPETDQFIGRVLDGRYLIEELVARGGMAVVYRANDMRLVRTVALKVLSSRLVTDPGFVDRFTREARAAASLTHPNVVAVHDQGVSDGHPYLVMEYVPGQTVREVLASTGPFASAHALEIMKSVLAGLMAAHEAGFLHRDVKPENVLITQTGHVKVTDFGLARVIDDTPVSDSTGSVLLGTMAYLSPEQVQQLALDERSDVYSAGILLYEMLTGRVPFTGSSPLDVAYQHVNQDVPAPSALMPDVPPAIDHIVLSATRRNRDDRTQSAHSFLDAVNRATIAVPIVEPLRDSLRDTAVIPETPALSDTAAIRGAHRATGELPAVRTQRTNTTTHSTNTRRFAEKKKRKHRGTRFALGAVLVAIMAGAIWMFTGQYVTMPKVAGQTQESAMKVLADAGLTAKVEPQFSEDIPVGAVTGTNPAAGTRARRGLPVTLFVSKGQERYTIPDDLTGKDEASARAELTSLTLVIAGTRQAYDDTVKAGLVISTDPAAGTLVKRETPVTIIISRGPAPVDVPGILGMDIQSATTELTKAGLVINVKDQVYDDATKAGAILAVSPLPGTSVPRGSTVDVTVSKGPVLIEVPDVVGLSKKAATAKLTAAGFTVKAEDLLPIINLNKVYSQSIAAGTQAPKGSLIVLKIV